MSHENAPATKILATNCACCGHALVDAASVESGIGPECRKRYAIETGVSEDARTKANAIVHSVARRGITRGEVANACVALADLGFKALAERLAKRFRMKLELPKVEDLRSTYAKIRAEFCYDNCTPSEFNELVKAGNPTTPFAFVERAKNVTCTCKRCMGTGRFVVGTINGKPNTPGGECYRCAGKGYQTIEDARRNRAHDRYHVNARVA